MNRTRIENKTSILSRRNNDGDIWKLNYLQERHLLFPFFKRIFVQIMHPLPKFMFKQQFYEVTFESWWWKLKTNYQMTHDITWYDSTAMIVIAIIKIWYSITPFFYSPIPLVNICSATYGSTPEMLEGTYNRIKMNKIRRGGYSTFLEHTRHRYRWPALLVTFRVIRVCWLMSHISPLTRSRQVQTTCDYKKFLSGRRGTCNWFWNDATLSSLDILALL